MRKVLVLSAVGALLLAAAALHSVRKPVWSKAHVPLEKAQLCHNGRVIAVDASAVDMHVEKHGDCFCRFVTSTMFSDPGMSATAASRGRRVMVSVDGTMPAEIRMRAQRAATARTTPCSKTSRS